MPEFPSARLDQTVDAMAIAVAIALPWSTSLATVFIVLWALATLPTIRWNGFRRALAHPAGLLPVLLLLMGAAGMLWTEGSLDARWEGFNSFPRFIVIPLLLAQFSRSDRGRGALLGFLGSCVVLLLTSTALKILSLFGCTSAGCLTGTPVRTYESQSLEFVLCAFFLLPYAIKPPLSRAVAAAVLAAAFLASILYVATGRTALVVMLALALVFLFRQLSWRQAGAAVLGLAVLSWATWFSSPYLRTRVGAVAQEVSAYETEHARTSSGQRLEYWTKSVRFIAQAPVLGHGTGSIETLFRRAAQGQTGLAAEVSGDAHNQTLTVGVQLGLIGIALLWAMWGSHLLLFAGRSPAAWIGLVICVQSVIACLFNSFLFDFTEGWIYIFGVGIAGGTVLRAKARHSDSEPAVLERWLRRRSPAPPRPGSQPEIDVGIREGQQ